MDKKCKQYQTKHFRLEFEQAQQLTLAKVKLEGQGQLVKEFLPQVGDLTHVFNSLKMTLKKNLLLV